MANRDTYKRRGLDASKDFSSTKHNVRLGSRTEVKKWAERIGPRSVAAAARYGKKPEVKGQE